MEYILQNYYLYQNNWTILIIRGRRVVTINNV